MPLYQIDHHPPQSQGPGADVCDDIGVERRRRLEASALEIGARGPLDQLN